MYTAEELIWATQLAYCNFKSTNTSDKTVQEIVAQEGYSIYYNYKLDDTPTGDKKTMREETEKFIDAVIRGEKCSGWKIVSVLNKESEAKH